MVILEDFLAGLKEACLAFPDKRNGGGGAIYSMADIGLSAFSLFFMQSESFLAYQRGLEEGRKSSNCQTLFGMTKIPTDNHIRSMLDPVHPSHLQSSFDQVVATLCARGGMKAFERLSGHTLIALDGTEYFCSQKLGCPNCQTRKRSNGKIEANHSIGSRLRDPFRIAAAGIFPLRLRQKPIAAIGRVDEFPECDVTFVVRQSDVLCVTPRSRSLGIRCGQHAGMKCDLTRPPGSARRI